MIRPKYLREDEEDCQCIGMGFPRHDERNECKVCGLCFAQEVTLKYFNDSYEDKGTCIECAMKLDSGLTIEEIAGIVSK